MTARSTAPTLPSRAHLMIFAATVVACIPYATLKVIWLLGSDIGTTDAEAAALMRSTEVRFANAATLGLEVAAVAVAAALTFAWGRRLPAPLVLVPMWLGSGLLAPVALGLPVGLLVQAVAGGSPEPSDNGLHGWVYGLVYGGFVLQAPLLVAAFVLYARNRWDWVFRARGVDVTHGPTRPVQTVLIRSALGTTAMYATTYAVWGLTDSGVASVYTTAAQRTFLLVGGALPLAGAVAVLRLVHGNGEGRLLPAVAIGWVGSGAVCASAMLQAGGLNDLDALLRVLGAMAGVAIAVAGLLALLDTGRSDLLTGTGRQKRVATVKESGTPYARPRPSRVVRSTGPENRDDATTAPRPPRRDQ